MPDKEFLERINIAYAEYAKQIGSRTSIENFISWMYKQYGLVEHKKDNK
jgi:hypothetical protein